MQKLFKIDAAAGQLRLQLQHSHRAACRACWACARSSRSGRPGARECVRRRVYFQLQKKKDKLHLLQGPGKDPAGHRQGHRASSARPKRDAEVVPNLMIGFGIDQVQAEYVAEIKLRNINKEYILNRTAGDGRVWNEEIADLEETCSARAADPGSVIMQGAGAGRAESTASRARPASGLRPPRSTEPDGAGRAGLSGHGLPLPRGLFQEDHAAVPAHVRRAEVQGGRRPAPRAARRRTARSCSSSPTSCQVYKARLSGV